MLIDPHMTLMRTAPEGQAIYAGVMRRIAERSEPPPRPLLHFTGLRGDEFLVGTVFLDPRAMNDMFTGYTAPESTSEMNATSVPVDIARFEYELDQLYIEDGVATSPFGFVPANGIAACTSEVVAPSPETYWQVVESGRWFEQPVPGRIAHIAYRSGEAMHAIGFWESREIGSAWYRENMHAAMESREPGRIDEAAIEASWIDLDTFHISDSIDPPMRHFVRKSTGPVSMSSIPTPNG